MRNTIVASLLMMTAIFAFYPGESSGRASDRTPEVSSVDVEPDSLLGTVQFLSIDPATLEYRTRFCLREAELFEITTYLAGKLEEITGNPPLLESFEIVRDFGSGDTTFTAYNIIADADLCVGCEDVVLITAHYDATGSRSPGYYGEWETAPAPGANDNGTGVAGLLEAARVLCSEELPFDLRFVLFSGEELGRLGSIDYVGKCDLDPQCPGRILAVINLDMLGYSGTGRGVSIMSDEFSGWLAYAIEETTLRLEPSLAPVVIKPGPWNWDHASFWEKDGVPVSAITLAEPLEEDGGIIYPDYHTLGDVPENVDFEQVGMITGILTGFIMEKATASPEFTMFDTDMVFYVDGVERSLRNFQESDEVSVHVKVRNVGGMPAGTEDVRLRVVHGTAAGSEVLFDGEADIPGVFKTSDAVILLPAGSMHAGGHILEAEIDVSSEGDVIGNNSAKVTFSVEGSAGGLIGHNMRPNPVTNSFSEALFCVDLEVAADLRIEIMTLEGDLVARGELGYSFGRPLDAGYTCIRCGDLFNGEKDLVSGIYIYRIRYFGQDGTKSDHHGRFAIVR